MSFKLDFKINKKINGIFQTIINIFLVFFYKVNCAKFFNIFDCKLNIKLEKSTFGACICRSKLNCSDVNTCK